MSENGPTRYRYKRDAATYSEAINADLQEQAVSPVAPRRSQDESLISYLLGNQDIDRRRLRQAQNHVEELGGDPSEAPLWSRISEQRKQLKALNGHIAYQERLASELYAANAVLTAQVEQLTAQRRDGFTAASEAQRQVQALEAKLAEIEKRG